MKTNLIENRQIRIFISSTFRDMQSERNYLVDKIFPTLKKYCQERDVTLIELDLRWGISEEDSKQGKVVEICMQEIENTHPFFIGLLGERYGWIPSQEEISVNTQIPDLYPWITSDLAAGLSITEIEMQYGVLRSQEDVNAYFYLRSPEMIIPEDFKEKTGSEEEGKLKLLKKQICSQDKYPVKNYASVEELGRQVEADFKKLVDTLFPQGQLSEMEKERLQQKAFLKSRTGAYISNPDNDKCLDDFITDDSSALVITGESGLGKSALIANWIAANKGKMEGQLIYHFVGNSGLEGDYRKITQRLINEIKWVYGLSDDQNELDVLSNNPSANSDKQKEELEKLLLSIADKERLLIILDGINQLAEYDNAKLLNWLPVFPKNVKVIYSTLPDDATMEVFKRREYPVFTLQPLDIEKREELIRVYLDAYGKSLLPEQEKRIASDKECENTLVLRTLLDELRVFGVHEEIDQRIEYHLSATDIHMFFDKVLARIELSYNFDDTNFVGDVFALIAVSRSGLSETELLQLTGVPPLYWVQLYHAIASHLTIKNGLITFSHSYLRDSVRQRYLNPENEIFYRDQIVNHYEESVNRIYKESTFASEIYKILNKSSFYRIYEELPYQLHKLHRYDRLYYFLLDFEVFDYIFDKDIYELGAYWRTLIDENKEKYQLKAYLGLEADKRKYSTISRLYNNIGIFVNELFRDGLLTLEYLLKALAIDERVLGTDHPDIATSFSNIGTTFDSMGDYPKASQYHLKALTISECVLGTDHPDIAAFYSNIGANYGFTGNHPKALECHLKALTIRERVLGTDHPDTATSYNNIGVIFGFKEEYHKSLQYYLKALAIRECVLGTDHPDTVTSYNNIGSTYDSMGNYPKALGYYLKALTICERVLGTNHPSTAIFNNNIGTTYDSMGDYPKALEYYLEALAIRECVLGTEHLDTATSYNNVGSTYNSMDDYPKALKYYLKTMAISERILGTDHPNTATTYNNIGTTYDVMGDYPKAMEYKMKALAIFTRVLGTDHPNTATSYSNIAVTYDSMGDYPKALEYYLKALAIRKSVLGMDHPDTAISYNNTAVIYDSIGDYPKALKHYLKALNIRKRILGTHHPDTVVSYMNMGDCFDRLGYYKNAIEYYKYYVEHVDASEREILAFIYTYVGDCFINLGCYAIAKEMHQKALKIREILKGKDSSEYAVSCCNIGKAMTLLEEYDRSLDYLAKDIAIMGEDSWVSISYYWIARNYQMQKNYTLALDNYQKALSYLEPCPEDILNRKAEIRNSFASYFLETGDILEAEQQNSQARELCEHYYKGGSHPLLAHILRQAGAIEKEKGNTDKAFDLYQQSKTLFIHFHDEDSLFAAQIEDSLQELK